MHLKPSPLVEASAIYGITWLGSMLFFWLASGLNVDDAQRLAIGQVSLLLPSFTLWASLGWLVRKKPPRIRFFTNVSVSTLIAVGISILLAIASGETSQPPQRASEIVATGVLVTTAYYFLSVAAAALTQFYIVKPRD